jgi:hypothetical protein
MLVFIDESGDPGFKLDKGSTPVFAASMVIFRDADKACEIGHSIRVLRESLGVKPEFKFSRCKPEFRDAFFESVVGGAFTVRAIVVQKALIYSQRLKTVKEEFYRFFIKSMVRFDDGALQDADVVIDGSGDRAFRNHLKTHLKRHSAPGAIRRVRLKNSRGDDLIQLADMCAGAIARSYRTDRRDADRWRAMLRPRIEDIWEFK